MLAFALLVAARTGDDDDGGDATAVAPDAVVRAHDVLPPGNYGGLPTNDDSLDQLPFYDGLTPLRGNVTDADIEGHYLPQDFEPVGDTTEEPTPRDGVEILDDEFGVAHVTGETREAMAYGAGWVAGDAPALDADEDDEFDDAGATAEPLILTALEPVLGELAPRVVEDLDLDGDTGASVLDKDLRTLQGDDVDGPFNLQYCGGGDLDQCREDLWAVIDEVGADLAEDYGSDDPSTWLGEALRIDFEPGLIDETFRATNRSTFQQLLEFVPQSSDDDG